MNPQSIHIGSIKMPQPRSVRCGDGVIRKLAQPQTPDQAIEILNIRSKDHDFGYETPCRVWVGALVGGYGQIIYKGKTIKCHQLSWIIKNGPVPNGLEVCHHCNNQSCFRVEHLWVGTHKENMRHAARSGVMGKSKGVEHYARKLLPDDVFFIRTNSDLKSSDMARWFGVTSTLIIKVKKRKIWKHI